ncbi:MAG: bifunctional DNA-binding transcriptional regulator/O6-methylguanine-DNA methyltransferase Ada [Candidatus Glassbacteria bacterium]
MQEKLPLEESGLWRAVTSRDRNYDGVFFYAVLTTGVYCRPHCASRKPRRNNVLFFFSAEGARKAGFRPCLKCRPEDSPEAGLHEDVVLSVCRYIETREGPLPTQEELSRRAGFSASYLNRLFKRVLGLSPLQYADACRQARLKAALRSGEPITSALYESGYGSSSRLYEKTSKILGMTPRAYKTGGRGQSICYSIVTCPLGYLLVAATARGLCSVKLGDSGEELVRELNEEFGNAVVSQANARLARGVQLLADFLSGSAPWPELPCDVRATAFQRKVWECLRAVPPGTTVNYSRLAEMIGKPGAARAVAAACAANPLAIVIPCHRVVPLGGGTGGYRWGKDRKKAILEIERNRPAGDG